MRCTSSSPAERQLDLDELHRHSYVLPHVNAVRHAFRVASGLDSMVLGEPQILGQMKEAEKLARNAGGLGLMLNHLFQRTFAVAKEVRTTTEIGTQSVSMAAAAVRVARKIFGELGDSHVLFVGAGEMIDLTATHFAAQRPKSITVANRTLDRAEALAARLHGQSMKLGDLPEAIARFDIVVSCTASLLPIIGLGMVERAIRTRRHKPMFIVDLAVPRDVEPEVARLDDVYVHTVDDLGKVVASGNDTRQAAVAQAEAIIESRVRDFEEWIRVRRAVPTIQDLHGRADALRAARAAARAQAACQGRAARARDRAAVARADQQVSARSDERAARGRRRCRARAPAGAARALLLGVSRLPHVRPAVARAIEFVYENLHENQTRAACEAARRDRRAFVGRACDTRHESLPHARAGAGGDRTGGQPVPRLHGAPRAICKVRSRCSPSPR